MPSSSRRFLPELPWSFRRVVRRGGHAARTGAVVLLSGAILSGCSSDSVPGQGVTTQPCSAQSFRINILPPAELPNIGIAPDRLEDSSVVRDGRGIRLFEWNGGRFYHPVYILHECLGLIEAYRATGEPGYRERLTASIDRLIDLAYTYDGAIYFPYQFDYNLHGQWLLKAPWFSGMAQGEMLAVLVRTFEVTGDSTYLRYADSTFGSFLRIRGEAVPWTVRYDSLGCFWIEEYPHDEKPGMTLNGFIAAIYGVYDYYRVTGSAGAERVLQESLATIKSNVASYRRPGQCSYYCLGHLTVSEGYHALHIRMLRDLARITGDGYFSAMADSLYQDFH